MSNFTRPFRPFRVTFRRVVMDADTVNFMTAVSVEGGDSVATATTVCSRAAGKDPDTVANIKIDHHNKLVEALSLALQQKLKL